MKRNILKKLSVLTLGCLLCISAVANDRAIITTRASQVMYADSAQAAGLPQSYSGRNVLLGIIDSGFMLWHNAFLTADGTPRYHGLMSVNPEVQSFDPDSLLLRQSFGRAHGTNTMCVAGGTPLETTLDDGGSRLCTGVATEAELVPAWLNTTSDTLSQVFIDFEEDYEAAELVDRIFAYADSLGMPCVINMSQGHTLGLHHKNNRFGQLISRHYNEPGHIIVMSSANSGGSRSCFDYTFSADSDTLTLSAMLSYRRHAMMVWSPDTSMLDLKAVSNGITLDLTSPTCPIRMLTEIDTHLNRRWMMLYPANDSFIYVKYVFAGRAGLHLEGYTYEAQVDLTASLNNGQSAAGIVSDRYSINDRICNPYVISVGVAGYVGSSWGYDMEGNRYPDICAPGYLYFATHEHSALGYDTPGSMPSVLRAGENCYFSCAMGTSYASPHVAGIIALMLEANPTLTTDQVRTILTTTHQDITVAEENLNKPSLAVQQEIGMVDALAAVRAALATSGIEQRPATSLPVKRMENGHLVIIKDGVRYNAMGVRM